jgi:hypothetical protein
MARKVTVLHHDNCFDGAASAAVFTSVYLSAVDPHGRFRYRGVHHRAGNPFEPGWFDGDVNAVVDFRYTLDPRLTWWFDHHASAFAGPEERRHFDEDKTGRKFYDPDARSCTKFIARVARERFAWEPGPLQELIDWADLIDGAMFPDARFAVELREPALRLMSVIEANRDREFIPSLIEAFRQEPLDRVAERGDVRTRFAALHARHEQAIEAVRARAREADGVVIYDLSDTRLDAINKFIPYYLFPDCRYMVGVSLSDTRAKVSVGSNPWSAVPRRHNLARICERYGGGGHAVVGAISLRPEDIERARQAAQEIAEELRRP